MEGNARCRILQAGGRGCCSHNIRVFGLGESSMEHILHDMMEKEQEPDHRALTQRRPSASLARHQTAGHDRGVRSFSEPLVQDDRRLLGDDVCGVDIGLRLNRSSATACVRRVQKARVAESLYGAACSPSVSRISPAARTIIWAACALRQRGQDECARRQEGTLDTVGAVSAETAEQMAAGVAKALGADISAWASRASRPGGGTEDKPAGLVYISVWYNGKFFTRKTNSSFGRDRAFRMQAASTALDLIRRHIL